MRNLVVIALLLGGVALTTAQAEGAGAKRLKFKQGPVCMCSKGLSEKDIREAEKAREQLSGQGGLNKLRQNEEQPKGREEE
ncbi:MAG: hypothetical protein OQK94_03375 [Gammaproteobacteria bacterium]|nr:hypothetical protein [Gammaproteobacteria bacterium]MCW8840342.1 hypothetical protein [Gammaproteobacteria bacterium]MCW8959630.1 hypothetical protein [Gammaproteobacteria bacterium]MCW8973538.1 hypothetical protein [Gammaproteobacteria bacterium]MCW8993635.1 hypothetical protein [Gammaproteobacteria bacterium]